MMRTKPVAWTMAAWLAVGGAGAILVAAEDEPSPKPKPTREERPGQSHPLAPDERGVKAREFRERTGASPSNRVEGDRSPEEWGDRWGGLSREEMERRREEWRTLAPEERQAKMKAWRERWSTNRPNLKNLSPEEREAKRQEFRERFEKQLQELRKKKTDGTLTAAEQRRLDRMEEISKRFEPGGQGGGPRPSPLDKPRENEPPPPTGDK